MHMPERLNCKPFKITGYSFSITVPWNKILYILRQWFLAWIPNFYMTIGGNQRIALLEIYSTNLIHYSL